MQPDTRIRRFLETVSIASSTGCVIFGLIVLVGWLTGVDVLKNPLPKQIPVAPTTGIGFLLSGLALNLCRRPEPSAGRTLAKAAACMVFLLGAMILPTYIFPGSVDFEQCVFLYRLGEINHFAPGRMAPNTAIGLVFSGIALMLLALDSRHYIRAQTIGCVIAAMGYFTFIGYLFGFSFMYGIAKFTNMALPTGLAFLALAAAILFYRPSEGLTAVLTDSSTAGFVGRRLVPAAILVPALLGAIRVHGQKLSLFDWDFGVCLVVVGTTIVMLALIGITSHATAAVEGERARLQMQRENFMAVLIHDLKNPLIGAERVLEHLLAGALDPLTTKQHSATALLYKTNHELLDMIKNLLELYRLDKGKETLHFETINILPLVNRSVGKLRALAEAERKYLRTLLPDSMPSVRADAAALELVLGNLVQNAIKFTPAEGVIQVTAEHFETLVLIKVRDTGKGISAKEQERLFRPFSQGETGKQFTSGTGLGLYLSHQLVAAHKGHLTCLSQPDEGTTFIISLPALQQKVLQQAEEADRRHDGR
jgi:signal transduction histidine kinase